MAVYIVVMGVTLLVLLGAYRSMGGEPPTAEASEVTLDRIIELMREQLPQTATDGVPEIDTSRAHEARRALSGLLLTLDQLDLGSYSTDSSRARELLRTAADDLTWACRLIESGGLPQDQGISDAVAALRGNAARCLDEARAAAPHVVPA